LLVVEYLRTGLRLRRRALTRLRFTGLRRLRVPVVRRLRVRAAFFAAALRAAALRLRVAAALRPAALRLARLMGAFFFRPTRRRRRTGAARLFVRAIVVAFLFGFFRLAGLGRDELVLRREGALRRLPAGFTYIIGI
jgi:hypothetical protein